MLVKPHVDCLQVLGPVDSQLQEAVKVAPQEIPAQSEQYQPPCCSGLSSVGLRSVCAMHVFAEPVAVCAKAVNVSCCPGLCYATRECWAAGWQRRGSTQGIHSTHLSV